MDFVTGGPNERRPPFHFSALARVWFSDTDAQGVVYYGRYMPYLDHARREYVRHLGLLEVPEAEFAMRALQIEYEAPARFDDILEVFIRTTRIGHSSVTTEAAAYRMADDHLMCTARQTLVLVDRLNRRPTPVPAAYRAALAGFEGAGLVDAGRS